MALNGKEVSRKSILNIVVPPPNSKIDVNQNSEVKAEPLDDEIAEVVELDDRPLNEARFSPVLDNVEFSSKFPQLARFRSKAKLTKQKVLHSHNSNANNNRGNSSSSSDDDSMAIIDCAGNGTDMVEYSSDDVMTIKSNEQRVRPPYRFRVDYFYALKLVFFCSKK